MFLDFPICKNYSIYKKYPIIKRKRGFPMLYSIFQKLFYKIRQETVLSIAVLLALLSACFVLPDASYFG